MHLVAKRQEMPEEVEINRESRKKLAELMLEYPTEIDRQEEADEAERRRKYTCVNCKMPFKTPKGEDESPLKQARMQPSTPKGKSPTTNARIVTELPRNRTC